MCKSSLRMRDITWPVSLCKIWVHILISHSHIAYWLRGGACVNWIFSCSVMLTYKDIDRSIWLRWRDSWNTNVKSEIEQVQTDIGQILVFLGPGVRGINLFRFVLQTTRGILARNLFLGRYKSFWGGLKLWYSLRNTFNNPSDVILLHKKFTWPDFKQYQNVQTMTSTKIKTVTCTARIRRLDRHLFAGACVMWWMHFDRLVWPREKLPAMPCRHQLNPLLVVC